MQYTDESRNSLSSEINPPRVSSQCTAEAPANTILDRQFQILLQDSLSSFLGFHGSSLTVMTFPEATQ